MAAKLTIIGMGQIGTSIGLALAGQKELLTRMGHDKDYSLAQKAQKLGALDGTHYNLPASVQDADIVILSMPLDGIRRTLEIIGPDLKEGAVVLDTCPVKAPVLAWVKAYLPADRHYVGLVPAINPAYLHEIAVEQDAARADLFKTGLIGIVAPHGTPGEAIKLASDLAQLLGSKPFYMDAVETDGLMAGVHLLPQLMAAALINATAYQPGWLEARKLAGRPYASVSGAVAFQDVTASLHEAARTNRENTVRVLDNAINALIAIRDAVRDESPDPLNGLLERAYDARVQWWGQREKGDWLANEMTSTKEDLSPGAYLRHMFLGKWGKKDKE